MRHLILNEHSYTVIRYLYPLRMIKGLKISEVVVSDRECIAHSLSGPRGHLYVSTSHKERNFVLPLNYLDAL